MPSHSQALKVARHHSHPTSGTSPHSCATKGRSSGAVSSAHAQYASSSTKRLLCGHYRLMNRRTCRHTHTRGRARTHHKHTRTHNLSHSSVRSTGQLKQQQHPLPGVDNNAEHSTAPASHKTPTCTASECSTPRLRTGGTAGGTRGRSAPPSEPPESTAGGLRGTTPPRPPLRASQVCSSRLRHLTVLESACFVSLGQ